MDKGEGEQGRGDRDKKRDEENRKRWSRRSGLASRYTVGDHTEMRGNEAAVAFCILL